MSGKIVRIMFLDAFLQNKKEKKRRMCDVSNDDSPNNIKQRLSFIF